jgi:hypothetical protein
LWGRVAGVDGHRREALVDEPPDPRVSGGSLAFDPGHPKLGHSNLEVTVAMRRAFLGCVWLVCWGIAAGRAVAQQGATTVQLPTLSSFSASTTVTVPDRGMAYLGGVNRAAEGRNEFGVPLLPFRPFRNVGIGREVSSSGMWVSVTIHDFDAMDRYLLSQPTAFSQSLGDRRSQAAALAGTLQPRDPGYGASWRVATPSGAGGPPTMSVAQARAERQRQQATRADEAADFFRRAQEAEEAGKMGVAKIYYQMAARRATGELKGQVTDRLDAIGRGQTASKIAQDRP